MSPRSLPSVFVANSVAAGARRRTRSCRLHAIQPDIPVVTTEPVRVRRVGGGRCAASYRRGRWRGFVGHLHRILSGAECDPRLAFLGSPLALSSDGLVDELPGRRYVKQACFPT